MKSTKLVGMVALGFLMACGGSGDDSTEGGGNALSAGPTTPAPAATTPVESPAPGPTIASCNGNKVCVDAAVLRIVFTSNLQITREDEQLPTAAVGQVVAEWLGKTNDGRVTITVTPADGGKSTVDLTLAAGHETSTDEGDIEDLDIKFTIDGTSIVETSVKGLLAG